MSNTFFSSDMHYFHKNILNHHPDTRKHADINDMNDAIIDAHNSVVTKHDAIYMLGDISFGDEAQTDSVLQRLNGNKILIYGNHDQIIKKKPALRGHFNYCVDYKEIRINNDKIVMCHFPLRSWNAMKHGTIHLFGHTHGKKTHEWFDIPNSMDVGIDTRLDGSMLPYELEEIKLLLKEVDYAY